VALKPQIATAEARAAEEASKTTRAIAAFADLARRLNALAAERERQPPPPWWRLAYHRVMEVEDTPHVGKADPVSV
jgi:hypothetical protein